MMLLIITYITIMLLIITNILPNTAAIFAAVGLIITVIIKEGGISNGTR